MRLSIWLLLPGPLLLAACAAPARSTSTSSEASSKLHRVGELPERYHDIWVAWVDEDPDWPKLREEALGDPDLTRFLVENLARILVRTYRSGAIAPMHDPHVGPFERARAELLRIGAPAVPTLAELMAVADSSTAQLCADLLVEIGEPALDYVPALLGREQTSDRARAALLLGRLPHAGRREEALLAELARMVTEDPDWGVRQACVRALGLRAARQVSNDTARRALERALTDPEADVARAAAQALSDLGEQRSIPALLNFVERAERGADLASFEVAQRALRRLSHTGRSRSAREWRDWWRANLPPQR